MDKLKAIYEFAIESGIDVINQSFSLTKKAACLHLKPHMLVVLDKAGIETQAEECAVLAEEVGHYETGGLYIIESTLNSPVARNNRLKYEAQARYWAYRKYLPVIEIEEAVKREGPEEYEIATRCQVPVDFLRKAIEYHRSCGVIFSFDEENA